MKQVPQEVQPKPHLHFHVSRLLQQMEQLLFLLRQLFYKFLPCSQALTQFFNSSGAKKK